MPVIYIDVLLCLNLFIDFLLLSAVARVLHIPHRRSRMVAGAAVGALGSCALLLPTLPLWCTLLWQAAFATAMIRIAFRYTHLRDLLRRSGVLFLMSALFAGVAYFVWILLAPQGFAVINGVVYYDVPPLWLIALTLLSYGAVWLYERLRARRPQQGHEYRVTITEGSQSVTLRALYDTGNRLVESFSGNPVTVVQRAAVEALLPPAWDALLQGMMSPGDAALPRRLRLIPFRTVGGDGLLPAFCPERLTVTAADGSERVVEGGYIAVTDRLWRGEYEALIGNEITALFTQERKMSR